MVVAKKPTTKKPRPSPAFMLGDNVEILHFGPGKIIELRGPLGPGGAQVYRVRYSHKPRVAYIEVLGNQLRPAKRDKNLRSAMRKLAAVSGTSNGIEVRETNVAG
jgi:hypothetical protein